MSQEDTAVKTLDISFEVRIASPTASSRNPSPAADGDAGADHPLSISVSFSRLNASDLEFLPRALSPASEVGHPQIVKIRHHQPPSLPAIDVFHPPASPPMEIPQFTPQGPAIELYEYYEGANEGRGGLGEQDALQAPVEPNNIVSCRDDLSEDIVQKITNQVEYYFSDVNLATTEHLMRFISKDPDGFVPLSVVGSYKKIKALVHNNLLLANVLRTSSKLIISEDGKKVRRAQPITDSDVEELQSRIVVADNLSDDHSYQSLMKVFSTVGSVKTIRTCYPQNPNGSTAPTSRLSKLDMLFGNKLHAFVEYETAEDAERAVAEVNKEKKWRNCPRLRLLNKCMSKHDSSRGRKAGGEVDGTVEEEEVYSTNHLNDKHIEDPTSHQHDALFDFSGEVEGVRPGWARGRGNRGRNHDQHHHHHHHHRHQINNSHQRGGGNGYGHGHAIDTPSSSHTNHTDHPVVAPKLPPGPIMPDGTRGFTMGRGMPGGIPSSTPASV